MFTKNKKFIISGFLVVILFFGLFQIALAAVPKSVTDGLFSTAKEANISTNGNITNLIGNIIGAILSFIGVIFFALMVFGGFMWMTARGNEEQTKKALGTVTSAVIGLVIVLSSYTITNFVFQNTYLTPPPTPAGEVSNIDPKDVACDTAHQGWKCNDIDMCAEAGQKISISDDGEAPLNVYDINVTKSACEKSGKNSCLFSSETSEDPLCATTEGSPVQVCCQPQDESQKKYDWCFSSISYRCMKLDEFGKDNCKTDDQSSGYKILRDKTQKECYVEGMLNQNCVEDIDCKNSITNYVCIKEKCMQKVEGSGDNALCEDTSDCETGVCKNGTCTFLIENCNKNTKLSGLMCGPIACGKSDADVVCTSDSQCASNHCVDGKCESGDEGASCAKDGDCNEGSFCTSRGSTPCCLPKLEYGESCYGMNNACKSKNCDSKSGKCI